ncbi:iron-sulfur cluster repair di-iron protein, ric [Soehngenia longivitae]|uniref:Iron-sulfur cluster repair di-iron protein, ric n=1 Tax=Soehngenia longivitae TaxID=2562294 RepID=A0A4Z0D9T3_9FIRM|nr:iron-sulfur cluster repair di-iron protein, ric [Soehngenia longivitae]TFZ41668.1 iron-sulfur cluster repair di-iron protein, ric [Soehngenia longivitae]
MNKNENFTKAKEKYFKKLEQLIPIVDRVHGGNHLEFHEVRKVFNIILKKINESEAEKPNLDDEFNKLSEITHNYEVPGDVCETYESVYNMLSKVNEAYWN